MQTVFVTIHNKYCSQINDFFFLVKDIDKWNILSLKKQYYNEKKRSKVEDENFQFFIYAMVTRILYHKKTVTQ